MLWLRGAIFTILVPAVIGVWIPQRLCATRALAPGVWRLGWLLFGAGALLYLWCLASFLLAGGTPAIFFTRPLRFLIGEEPSALVRRGSYRFSRNPMYLAVVAAILGQGLVYRSGVVVFYGAAVWLCFHVVVVLLEEPHLRRVHGPDYEQYLRTVPRWLGWPQ